MPTKPARNPFGLLERFGVELEYMIVDRDSLAVAWRDEIWRLRAVVSMPPAAGLSF